MSVPWSWSEVDANEVIARFNLYALPLLVAGVVFLWAWRGRRAPIEPHVARARTVRLLGLCQYGLALRSLLEFVPEWIEFRQAGEVASLALVHVVWPLLAAAVYLPLGFGLCRLRRWARWGAIAVNALATGVALLRSRWEIVYGAAVYPSNWPELAVERILPFFVLVVLLAPRTARIVRAEERVELLHSSAPARPSVLSLIALGFLVVLGAIATVNGADWIVRYGLQAGAVTP